MQRSVICNLAKFGENAPRILWDIKENMFFTKLNEMTLKMGVKINKNSRSEKITINDKLKKLKNLKI